jgi:hypothetical protein
MSVSNDIGLSFSLIFVVVCCLYRDWTTCNRRFVLLNSTISAHRERRRSFDRDRFRSFFEARSFERDRELRFLCSRDFFRSSPSLLLDELL